MLYKYIKKDVFLGAITRAVQQELIGLVAKIFGGVKKKKKRRRIKYYFRSWKLKKLKWKSKWKMAKKQTRKQIAGWLNRYDFAYPWRNINKYWTYNI